MSREEGRGPGGPGEGMTEELEGQKDTNYHLGENTLGYHLQQKPSESSDSNDLPDPVRDRSSS